MRSMATGNAYHRAYRRATQQALLKAHEHAFADFGGVFREWRPRHSRNCTNPLRGNSVVRGFLHPIVDGVEKLDQPVFR
jgi:hypothetical protein